MRGVATFLLVLVTWVAGSARASRIKLVNNGYEDVVIGISPQVEESQGPAIIASLKEMMKDASRHLFEATRRRAFFRRVKVLIPLSWTNTAVNQAATTENFLESDIRVDSPHVVYGSQPYVVQTGGCGDPGEYLHLTPEYLTEDNSVNWWGPRGKHFVPLWARLQWGVFDELGYPGDPRYPLVYRLPDEEPEDPFRADVHTVDYTANYCADHPIHGRWKNVDPNSGIYQWCKFGPDNLPDHNCRFNPSTVQQATSSLMSYPFILSDSIVHFCDQHTHISDAPNRQNDMCKGRSVWEVMEEHRDFKNGANPPIGALPQDPEVMVVQESYASYAVVMDYSGSMSTNERIIRLQKTAQRWLLHEVPDKSFVSLIRFSSSPATVLAPLTQITDQASREQLAGQILTNNSGGTSIGSGLRSAVQVLAGHTNKNILLITDGEENESPRISEVKDEVVDICVITVALGLNADPGLEELSHSTGCKTFTVNDNDQSSMMSDAFQSTLTRQPTKAPQFTDIKIYESQTYDTKDLRVQDSFVVDNSIGRNLTFRLKTTSKEHIVGSPWLTDPDGNVINATDFDDISLMWSIIVPLAKIGTWEWEAELDGDETNTVQASVTGLQRDPDTLPISTRVWVDAPSSEVSAVKQKIKIFAEVKQGHQPIIGAVVRGVVSQPENVNAPPDVYILKDNGVGADTMKNDGIYSVFMSKFSTTGRYTIKAEVTNTAETFVNTGASQSGKRRRRRRSAPGAQDEQSGGPPQPCCGSVMPVYSSSPTGNFTRVATAGSLKVTEVPPSGSDVLPPARVMDLHIKSLVLHALTTGTHAITVTWTTPGDDLDQGTASNYVFRLSPNKKDLTEAQFDLASPDTLLVVPRKDFEDANVFVESGTEVTLTINFRRKLDFKQSYFVGMRAKDDSDNASEVSNVAKFTVEEKLVMPPWTSKRIQELSEAGDNFKRTRNKSR